MDGNKVAVFDVDVKGGINLKIFGNDAYRCSLPSLEVLRERLVKRGTDSAGIRTVGATLEMEDTQF